MAADHHSSSRRSLLKGAAGYAAVSFVGALQAFQSRQAYATGSITPVTGPFGPIAPVNDMTTGLPLLQLPSGFQYASFAWTGDPMSNGEPCPGSHDGMAVVSYHRRRGREEIVLIRNHELGLGPIINAHAKYDTATFNFEGATGQAAAGTTNLVFSDGRWAGVMPSLGGTLVNCAGGPTPWNTWLTCEEIDAEISDLTPLGGKKHGYVFEVCADPNETTGKPIVTMGRFSHEAAAVDPKTGYVYLTEDERNRSGLYRFIPDDRSGEPGSLERGGKLQAAKVKGQTNTSLLTPSVGDEYELEWVDIADPDANYGPYDAEGATDSVASGPFLQAWAGGALRMSRGEGIWYENKKIYVVDTSAGVDSNTPPRIGRGDGAVWELDLRRMRLKAIFVSANSVAGNNPDNITVSPRGQIFLCEDGGGVEDQFGFGDRLIGLTRDGDPYIFAKNNVVLSDAEIGAAGKKVAAGDYRGNEFAGACFDPKNRIMFVNIQTPGITFAIFGPWRRRNSVWDGSRAWRDQST